MRTHNRAIPPGRGGFTLVELLVAIGLTLFIMTIIVEAFSISMDAYSGFRAVGDVQNQSRAALLMLKNDLSNVRFEGGRKLSDRNFWDTPVKEGFFAVSHGSAPQLLPTAPYVDEGVDLDGVHHSFRATDHILHFGVRLRENRRDQTFSVPRATAPVATWQNKQIYTTNMNPESLFGSTDPAAPNAPPAVASQWAEIAYFLEPTKTITVPDPSDPTKTISLKLHNLYRMQLIVLPLVDKVNGQVAVDRNIFSGNAATNKFYSPNDIAAGATTRGLVIDPVTSPLNPAVEKTRASLVATNVVSFQVRIMKDPPDPGQPSFIDPPPQNNKRLFDSAVKPTAQPGQSPYRVIGVQVILRVFDESSGLTRQVTLVQDL
jgi:type II secretory pathway pseudopilin PulG